MEEQVAEALAERNMDKPKNKKIIYRAVVQFRFDKTIPRVDAERHLS